MGFQLATLFVMDVRKVERTISDNYDIATTLRLRRLVMEGTPSSEPEGHS